MLGCADAVRSGCLQASDHERVNFAVETNGGSFGVPRDDVAIHIDRIGDLQSNEILRLRAKWQVVDDAAVAQEIRNPDLPDISTTRAFSVNWTRSGPAIEHVTDTSGGWDRSALSHGPKG